MPGFEYGFKRAFTEIIVGLVIVFFIQATLQSVNMAPLVILFNIISIGALIFLFDKMIFWSLSYLIGWIFGFAIFSLVLTSWEIVLYMIITIFALCIKIKNKI